MKVAFIGFKQSGKSTIFSAVSGKKPPTGPTLSASEAVVPVPDDRFELLTRLYKPAKTVCATVDCLDLPGISLVDHAQRAAARKIINEARGCDMTVFVVRAFESEMVPPYRDSVDARRDFRELQSEFVLSDLELVLTRIERLEKQITIGSKTKDQDQAELAVHRKFQAALEEEKPARSVPLDEREDELVRSLGLLTMKPFMVLVNIGESDVGKDESAFLGAVDPSIPVVAMSAQIELELSQLDGESRKEFMDDLGLHESASSRFVNACYRALGLISFLTVGPDEVRAWPIREGSSALDAAGKIHSDIRRGFIRAATMSYSDLVALGDEKAVKEAGKLRLEGKTYTVQDGDIIEFKFNV